MESLGWFVIQLEKLVNMNILLIDMQYSANTLEAIKAVEMKVVITKPLKKLQRPGIEETV